VVNRSLILNGRSIAGAVAPFISAEWFIAEQLPGKPLEAISLNSRMVALQLGNIYLLLAMVGIAVLYTTTEARVVRNYVKALWIADIGHVAVTCWVMGHESLMDVAGWNAMAWGNIGVTVSCRLKDFYTIIISRAGVSLLRPNSLFAWSFW
jgi:hypothetical protein